MTQIGRFPLMQTRYLPKLCRKSQCIRDPIGDTQYCAAHQPKPKPAPPEWAGKSVVYMVGMEGSDAIKVGFASDLCARLIGMQVGTPSKLKVIAVFEGDRTSEINLHRELQEHHVRGEWFKADAVLALAEKMADQGYVRMRLKVGEVLARPNKNGYSAAQYGKARRKKMP